MSFLRFLFLWFGLLGLEGLVGIPGAQARPRPRYELPSNEQPVAVLHAGRVTYLVTQHSVLRLDGSRFVPRFHGTAQIQCAALADTVLWLGTARGVLRLNTREFRPRPLALPGPDAAPSITALFLDRRGTPWVGAVGQGVYRWVAGAFVPELNTPSINAGAATADSAVWIATSIGLSRKQGAEWTRYSEEGVANREIPDNIVEKLLPDNAGNLWVIMSDAICMFEGPAGRTAAGAELPTAKFLGRPGNEVYSVASVRGVGRVFATAMGLLLLPAGHLTSSCAPATDKVEQKRLLVPLPLRPGMAAPRLLEVDRHQRLWLVGVGRVTVMTAKEFRRFALPATPARPPVSMRAAERAGQRRSPASWVALGSRTYR